MMGQIIFVSLWALGIGIAGSCVTIAALLILFWIRSRRTRGQDNARREIHERSIRLRKEKARRDFRGYYGLKWIEELENGLR